MSSHERMDHWFQQLKVESSMNDASYTRDLGAKSLFLESKTLFCNPNRKVVRSSLCMLICHSTIFKASIFYTKDQYSVTTYMALIV